MYNTDFLPQIEEHRKYLSGSREPDNLPVPPKKIKILKCIEDANGEWVPDPKELIDEDGLEEKITFK